MPALLVLFLVLLALGAGYVLGVGEDETEKGFQWNWVRAQRRLSGLVNVSLNRDKSAEVETDLATRIDTMEQTLREMQQMLRDLAASDVIDGDFTEPAKLS